MPRTDEQRAADETLTTAIEAAQTAYIPEREPSVLTEYVIITASRSWDEHGDGLTEIDAIYKDNDVPHYRILGLCEFLAAQMRAEITQPDDD